MTAVTPLGQHLAMTSHYQRLKLLQAFSIIDDCFKLLVCDGRWSNAEQA